MRNLLPFFFLCIFLSSCDTPEPLPPPPPTETRCNLELSVVFCFNALCQETSPFANAPVEIFTSEEDARLGINRYRSGTTDEEGKLSLTNLDCGFIWIRIVTEDRGTYIELFSLSSASSQNFEQIEFVNGLVYDNGSVGFAQAHISLTTPILGQQSKYLYHESVWPDVGLDMAVYPGDTLTVRFINQLDENSFLVEERLDSLENVEDYFYPDVPVVRSRWTFYEDSIRISPHEEETYGSFIWQLKANAAPIELDGYTFSLNRPSEPIADLMSGDPFSIELGINASEDISLFDNLFQDLILDKRDYTAVDGPNKLVVYSSEDGVVTSINLALFGAHGGFDLLLE